VSSERAKDCGARPDVKAADHLAGDGDKGVTVVVEERSLLVGAAAEFDEGFEGERLAVGFILESFGSGVTVGCRAVLSVFGGAELLINRADDGPIDSPKPGAGHRLEWEVFDACLAAVISATPEGAMKPLPVWA